jgi:hypothetical protein
MAPSGQSRKQQARSEHDGHSMPCPVHRQHSYGPHLLVAASTHTQTRPPICLDEAPAPHTLPLRRAAMMGRMQRQRGSWWQRCVRWWSSTFRMHAARGMTDRSGWS